MRREVIVFPGQRVITTGGEVVVVAFVRYGQVHVYGRDGMPKAVSVATDAWGGEHDQTIELVA